MLLTFITCQIYAITTILLGFITKPKVRNQRACQAFYIYPPEYLRCFYGLGVVTTCVVIFFQVWITLLSHSMKSVSSKIERANKKNFHITTTKIPANTKNDYSKIKRTMTLVLVNYVVMWCLPQLAYFILLTVHANDDWNSLVSEIQNYFNIIHANLSMLIYLTTYSDLKKLFINFLLEK
uniref:G_PROTEIN_RECEP_F1_2 domain-containing protein n=1 Tax=Parastrongyloides trichosuri TaxID=131310 RepID=A0A0N4ZK12_PARTI